MAHWSKQEAGAGACRWSVLRDGREEACGVRSTSETPGRCKRHRDRRSLAEQTLDPLGPYVAQVFKIAKQIEKVS